MNRIRFIVCILLIVTGVSCSNYLAGRNKIQKVVLSEAFMTERNETNDIDSPVVWHGSSGEHYLISTAKQGDKLIVYDARSGKHLRSFGSSGIAPGKFERPNGIAVVDNLLFVVERDNHRVQVFRLPDFKCMGFFGEEILIRPYGIFSHKTKPGTYNIYITDNYMNADGSIPADRKLDQRVKLFTVKIQDMSFELESTLIRSFGDTEGTGVLHKVESIYGDPENNVLLIAEEDKRYRIVKVYTLDGRFTGRLIGKGMFNYEPEGITLYTAPGNSGYWIMTDQHMKNNLFLIFDRKNFTFCGAFTGIKTSNTDGIAVTNRTFDPFPSGAFYAVHDDGGVAAFSWRDISSALGLHRKK